MTAGPKIREDGIVVNTAHPGHFSTTVIENRSLSERYYLLLLSRPQGFEDPGPGTFVHLLVPDGGRFYLRRPFSVLDCDGDTISLIVVEKGSGTQLMRHLAAGERMDLIGPMGASFPRVPGKRVLSGVPVEEAASLDALANPEALRFFVELARAWPLTHSG